MFRQRNQAYSLQEGRSHRSDDVGTPAVAQEVDEHDLESFGCGPPVRYHNVLGRNVQASHPTVVSPQCFQARTHQQDVSHDGPVQCHQAKT